MNPGLTAIDIIELVLTAGVEVLKLVNSGATKAQILERVQSIRADAQVIDADVDAAASPAAPLATPPEPV